MVNFNLIFSIGQRFRARGTMNSPPAAIPERYGQLPESLLDIMPYFCNMSYLDHYLETISQIKPLLQKKFSVNSIGLFGSVVRSDFSVENSDIDIVVDFSKPIGIEFIDLGDYLEGLLNRKVDLLSRNGIKPEYFKAIESEIVYV